MLREDDSDELIGYCTSGGSGTAGRCTAQATRGSIDQTFPVSAGVRIETPRGQERWCGYLLRAQLEHSCLLSSTEVTRPWRPDGTLFSFLSVVNLPTLTA